MSIEDHPHVTRSSQKALDMGLAPYVLVVPGIANYWMDEEDLLILHATCERMLKEERMTDYIIMFTVRDADSYPSDLELDGIAEAVAPVLGVDESDITDLDWEESE